MVGGDEADTTEYEDATIGVGIGLTEEEDSHDTESDSQLREAEALVLVFGLPLVFLAELAAALAAFLAATSLFFLRAASCLILCCSRRSSFLFLANSSLSTFFVSRIFLRSSFSIASCSFFRCFSFMISIHSALVKTRAFPVFVVFSCTAIGSRCLLKSEPDVVGVL